MLTTLTFWFMLTLFTSRCGLGSNDVSQDRRHRRQLRAGRDLRRATRQAWPFAGARRARRSPAQSRGDKIDQEWSWWSGPRHRPGRRGAEDRRAEGSATLQLGEVQRLDALVGGEVADHQLHFLVESLCAAALQPSFVTPGSSSERPRFASCSAKIAPKPELAPVITAHASPY